MSIEDIPTGVPLTVGQFAAALAAGAELHAPWEEPPPVARVESFQAPDHSVWCLRRTFIDKTFHPWHWDGQPFAAAGPAMQSPDFPLLRMPLIALIAEGLHSDTSAAVAAGEMAFQLHDMCDAGLIGGAA
jgi:hypothetical protein